MRATIGLTIGSAVTIRATARATPAGLVAVAVLITAIFVPVIWLNQSPITPRARRRLRRLARALGGK